MVGSPRVQRPLCPGRYRGRKYRLESAGHVRREAEPTDRRGVRVVLSDAGLALIDRAIEARFAEADGAVASLSKRERTTLERILRHLLTEIEREGD